MEVRRATVNDMEFIRQVYGRPDIWAAISDDNTPPFGALELTPYLSSTAAHFLIPDAIGVFFYHPWNSITYEMHSAVLPEFRGKQAMEGARLAGMWMFNKTLCRKIVTLIPAKNYRARALAVKGGMTKEGTVTQSYLKGGELCDQYIYGITKEAALCL